MQKQEMSPRLKQFNSRVGLCYNLYLSGYSPYEFSMLIDELRKQFISQDLDEQCPFNSDGEQYASEGSEYKTYQNEKRLAWIREHAK